MWSEAGPHAHTDHAAIAHAVGRWARLFAGELPDPCRGRAHAWGGYDLESDRARIHACVAAGRCEIVDCGDTKNTFIGRVRR